MKDDLIKRQNVMKKRNLNEMIAFFNCKVSEMEIPQKYKMELLGMITAIEMKHDELIPKWISVSEALPKNYEQTICIDSRGKMMIGIYGEYGWTFPCYMTEPVAWMPLPEPYRGD